MLSLSLRSLSSFLPLVSLSLLPSTLVSLSVSLHSPASRVTCCLRETGTRSSSVWNPCDASCDQEERGKAIREASDAGGGGGAAGKQGQKASNSHQDESIFAFPSGLHGQESFSRSLVMHEERRSRQSGRDSVAHVGSFFEGKRETVSPKLKAWHISLSLSFPDATARARDPWRRQAARESEERQGKRDVVIS